MIRATASAAAPRPTVRSAAARPVLLLLLLVTLLALVGTTAVGQRAAAASRGDIQVSADGVAFEPGRQSDEVTYVVRPAGGNGDGRAFGRDLTREEQYRGWAAFREAGQVYPDGYCVVWVEVEDASSWHETDGSTACTAAAPPPTGPPTATPTPTPTPTPPTAEDHEPAQTATPGPAQGQPVTAAPIPAAAPTVASAPSSTPTPSPTPSPTVSSTPSPSTSAPSAAAGFLPGVDVGSAFRTQVAAGGEPDEAVSSLGWFAVLGCGGLLAAGGLLMLWRRLT
ncbi:hypothetical protein AB1046_18595 [Promicromonospora sp. Populi]|uniref:hypothetical protein n=1 Tax=Promicromonospora sp. Populi TaxID=3239420 RepID=UPI0034E1B012